MPSSRSLVWMVLPLVSATLLTGCAEPAPKLAPLAAVVPASPAQAVDLQAQFMKLQPNARVGHVSAINASANIAAVGGIKVGDVRLGDSVQFLNASFQTIANGTVTSADTTHPDYPFLIVEYKALPTGRYPVVGDLVAYLPAQ